MSNKSGGQKNTVMLDDIAKALNLSKSTVSRAMSGEGRIGSETRRRVLEYISEHNYRPNSIARSLAKSKTNNIGVVLPAEAFSNEVPFFQNCLMGVCEAASSMDYDVVVTSVKDNDISQLKRIVENRKVDGILLTRALVADSPADYLTETGTPFVVVGSTPDEKTFQVDPDHTAACCELTSRLLDEGGERVALLMGDLGHTVNKSRYDGFLKAFADSGLKLNKKLIKTDLLGGQSVRDAVDAVVNGGARRIICSDDFICQKAIMRLDELSKETTDAITTASFYNSDQLKSQRRNVLVVDINVKELGTRAGENLIELIEKGETERRTLLGYKILTV
ncbi:MAG: LacI family transcriptional regulator [Ruminococcaceae bacterium]|nr:LacI family transcriptional regulator [Oscillospiraceae bacterium]